MIIENILKNLFLILSIILIYENVQSSEISFHDTTLIAGKEFLLPIYTSDLTSLNVIAFDCEILYNENILKHMKIMLILRKILNI